MQKKYKLIIFDLDGTLVDSRAAIVAGLADMAGAMGLAADEILRKPINIGLPMADILAGLGIEDIDAARAVYREKYRAHTHMEHAFAGIPELLEALHGRLPLAIASNKAYEGCCRTLGNAGIFEYFDFIAAIDQGIAKPDPDGFTRICAHYGNEGKVFAPQDCLMVGDSPIDRDFAGNAGIDFVFAQWGFHSGGVMGGGVRSIRHPAELLELI